MSTAQDSSRQMSRPTFQAFCTSPVCPSSLLMAHTSLVIWPASLTYRTVLYCRCHDDSWGFKVTASPSHLCATAGELVAPGITSVLHFFAYTVRDHLQFNHAHSGPLVRLHTGAREPPDPLVFFSQRLIASFACAWIISSREVPVECDR